jgi:glycosyltransferase involved in cell wall biosynthesis
MFADAASPKIDVLLSVYNCEKYLPLSLEGLRNQTFTDFRVLIVDDGSTDNSASIAEDFASRDPRFKVFRREHCGHVDALNFGLSCVTAPYIARHDADDISLPGRLAMELSYLERHLDVGAVSCCFFDISGGSAVTGINRPPLDQFDANPFETPAREHRLSQPFLLARTSEIRGVGGYRHILHSEDADLYWRLSLRTRLKNLPDVLGIYRRHSESVSAKSAHNAIVQSFFSQLAALSYRRVVALIPDFAITKAFADRIDSTETLDEMIDKVAGLTDAERAYLECSAYTKSFEAFKSRSIRVEPGFILAALVVYSNAIGRGDRNARKLGRRIRRGVRSFLRQDNSLTLKFRIALKYTATFLKMILWAVIR